VKLQNVATLRYVPPQVRNFLTIDVECWFHAYNLGEKAPRSTWHLQASRVEKNMAGLLHLLRSHKTKATFFVLGWVADHFPDAVRMIEADGHEIGTHGYHHSLVTDMTPMEFEADLLRSLEAISRVSTQRVAGFRASNFTITKNTLWALDILSRHGIRYDSSVFPIARKRYGIPNYPHRYPHTLELPGGRTLSELPMSTMRIGGKLLPVGGGGYLRLYPHQITEAFIQRENRRGLPAMVYLHPWELDVEQSRYFVGLGKTFQHYVNLDSTQWKLNRLLSRFAFTSVRNGLESPRIQHLLRRDPVQVADLYDDPHTAEANFAYVRDMNRSIPRLEAERLPVLTKSLPTEAVEVL
jgi:polysaccharide deacetylase family protein (PEP-CTERM system associated)